MNCHCFTIRRMVALLLWTATLLGTTSYAQVGGLVYRDFDGSGTRTLAEPNEIGASNVKVRAYVGDNATPLLTSTNAQGEFAFITAQIPAGSQAKLEFYV